jgi:hypothetical protein
MISACASSADLKRGNPKAAKFEVSGKSYSDVWRSANKVVSQQLSIIQSDKPSGVLKAEKGAGITTSGEVVGVFISPQDEKAASYSVEVLSLKRSSMQVTGQDWTQTVVMGMKSDLSVD